MPSAMKPARKKITETDWISPTEASKALNVHVATIHQWCKDDRVYFERIGPGHSIRVRLVDLKDPGGRGRHPRNRLEETVTTVEGPKVEPVAEESSVELLALSDFPPEATSNIKRDMTWAYEHAAVNVEERTAPGPGAVWWLRFIRESKGNRIKFVEVLKSQLPTPKQLEQLEKFEDDGRDVLGMIDRALADYREAREKGGDGALELMECPNCSHQWYG